MGMGNQGEEKHGRIRINLLYLGNELWKIPVVMPGNYRMGYNLGRRSGIAN